MSDTESLLLDVCGQALRSRGLATIAELQQVGRDAGVDLNALGLDDPDRFDLFLDGIGDFYSPVLDGRWTYLPTLLAGRVWTHRLTAVEAADDLVELGPDLEAIDAAADPPRLSDGSALEIAFDAPDPGDLSRPVPAESLSAYGTLLLPSGALVGIAAAAGDLVGFRTGPDGAELVRIDEPVDDGATLVAGFQRLAGDHAAQFLADVVHTLVAEDDSAFRTPTRPIAELIEAAGLEHRGELIAPAGYDFDAEGDEDFDDPRWAELTAEELALITALGELADAFSEALRSEPDAERADGSDALTAALSTALAAEIGPDGATVRDALGLLDEPMVADLAGLHLLGHGFHHAPVLVEMLDGLEPAAPRSARPPLRWLRGRAYERLGEVGPAEEQFRIAERLDPDWPLTLIDLARYAADRGDAVRALALLDRAGDAADPLWVASLRTQLPEPGPPLGRNEPCWCGSGRKFKQCHLHRPAAAPLERRVDWLVQKAQHFLAEGPWREQRIELSLRWLQGVPEAELEERMEDPLLDDVLLYEGGAIEDFLQVRGGLLPADERALAEAWLEVERSVFEITAVHPDGGVTVRDVRTGAEHHLAATTVLARPAPGQLFCARISPAGGVERLLGGAVRIAPEHREALLDELEVRDPVALIERLRSIARG